MDRPKYHRDYRPVTADDYNAAFRGLKMAKLSVAELVELRDRHCLLDAFASKVIAGAAQMALEIRRNGHLARAPFLVE